MAIGSKIAVALFLSATLTFPAFAEPLKINPFPLDPKASALIPAPAEEPAPVARIPEKVPEQKQKTIPASPALAPSEMSIQKSAPPPVKPAVAPFIKAAPAKPKPQSVEKAIEVEAMPLPVPQTGVDPVPLAVDELSDAHTPKPLQTQFSASSPWLAYAGADLREVLAHWSRRAGIELIWSSGSDFPVLNTLELGGSYQEAVRILLQQYDSQYIRPVGTIHNVGGKKTLVIQAWDSGGVLE
ncbi:MAG: toxin co-regulated pilus biosynthesis Q family protein [Alphaproteobacteria bacterium]|nr:toxin co-regulated pilus biosynthesis Q family protein [Alphaproteobacteria bacterium]